jgi:hypothetical protein
MYYGFEHGDPPVAYKSADVPVVVSNIGWFFGQKTLLRSKTAPRPLLMRS